VGAYYWLVVLVLGYGCGFVCFSVFSLRLSRVSVRTSIQMVSIRAVSFGAVAERSFPSSTMVFVGFMVFLL